MIFATKVVDTVISRPLLQTGMQLYQLLSHAKSHDAQANYLWCFDLYLRCLYCHSCILILCFHNVLQRNVLLINLSRFEVRNSLPRALSLGRGYARLLSNWGYGIRCWIPNLMQTSPQKKKPYRVCWMNLKESSQSHRSISWTTKCKRITNRTRTVPSFLCTCTTVASIHKTTQWKQCVCCLNCISITLLCKIIFLASCNIFIRDDYRKSITWRVII